MMRLTLLLLFVIIAAWLSPVAGFSALSSFTRRSSSSSSILTTMSRPIDSASTPAITMYDTSRDPPSELFNAWHVLASTERWISATLADHSPKPSSRASTNNNNPYTRKEVAYACESYADSPMIVANLFRRLKEVRQLGEAHANAQRIETMKGENE
jgi:hypothetical protein